MPRHPEARTTMTKTAPLPRPLSAWLATFLTVTGCFDFDRSADRADKTVEEKQGDAPPTAPTICEQATENASLSLTCPTGRIVSSIAFASFGLPGPTCSSSGSGACRADVKNVVEKACIGRRTCSVIATLTALGDPCPNVAKTLTVGANCSPGYPSCADGLDCGGTSCCAHAAIPAGTFPQGRSEKDTDSYVTDKLGETPEHEAKVSAFEIDAFEITVGRFRRFVEAYEGPPEADAGAHPQHAGSGWQTAWNDVLPKTRDELRTSLACDAELRLWTDEVGDNEQKPINCLDWYTTFAFCAWDGGRLPTESEWEYVAAGGDENRLFPWGAAPPTESLLARSCGAPCTGSSFPPVGSHPVGSGRWGSMDLAGSVWEWVLDAEYTYSPAACSECANIAPSAEKRGLRGGFLLDGEEFLRAARRGWFTATDRGKRVGGRCAYAAGT